jgi:cytolysin-activating lysine-acyltransferase
MTQVDPTNPAASPGGGGITVSHVLGEITWLLTQSPLHRAMAIGDLEWLVMPPLILRQFYIFREGDRPIGLALWARCSPRAVAKLEKGMLEPEHRLSLEEWSSGDSIWLVDLIAPFADGANRHREMMIADLISGPLAEQRFSFHWTDETTGERMVQVIEADAGERLKGSITDAVQNG